MIMLSFAFEDEADKFFDTVSLAASYNMKRFEGEYN
jgi:hypothetical protein